MRSLRRSPAKHIDLLPQDQVFRFQRCSRLEARSQDTENQPEQIGHQDASLRRPLAASTPNRIFGTHNPDGTSVSRHVSKGPVALRADGAVQDLVPGLVVNCRLDGNARIVTFADGRVARELLVEYSRRVSTARLRRTR